MVWGGSLWGRVPKPIPIGPMQTTHYNNKKLLVGCDDILLPWRSEGLSVSMLLLISALSEPLLLSTSDCLVSIVALAPALECTFPDRHMKLLLFLGLL